jgi:hypothetical protein
MTTRLGWCLDIDTFTWCLDVDTFTVSSSRVKSDLRPERDLPKSETAL